MSPDVIVLGPGGTGSAAAHHLAARGQRVLGPERFPITLFDPKRLSSVGST